jgi:hypothetical protein
MPLNCATSICSASTESCTRSGRSLRQANEAYANHPETVRWRGRLAALYARHDEQVKEMRVRGFNHLSPLDARLATGAAVQTQLVDVQRRRLATRGCGCPLDFGKEQG